MNRISLILSILLAGVVIVCGVTYRQYSAAKAELLESRKQSVKLSDFNRLSEELSLITQERAKAAERIGELQGEVSRLKKEQTECAGRQERIAQLQETQDKKDASIKELKSTYETQLADLSRELSRVTEERATATKRMGDLDGEISRLKNEQAKCAGLQERIAQLQKTQDKKDASIKELKSTYDALLIDLKKEIQAKEVTVNQFEEKLRIRLVNRVLFAEGSARITPEGRRILGQLGQILKKVKDKYIYVVGHTDDVPISSNLIEKFPSNWELSAARAAAVVGFLTDRGGISPEIFAAVGRSFYQPVGSNKSDEGRAQNRRAEIIIANSLGLKPQ